MRLKYAFLAEHANVTEDGKLNVLGIFDRLFAPSFPCLHRVLYLVTSYETEPLDAGTKQQLEIRFVDPDAKAVRDITGTLTFGVGKQVVNQLHVFNDLPFQVAGNYEFTITLDGKLLHTVGLELIEVQQNPAP